MGTRKTDLPTLYKAEDVAEVLGCSSWWVKEQARRGRIPFIRSGSGYRFKRDHVEEILLLLEERPKPDAEAGASASPKRRAATGGNRVVQLRSRRPRRSRNAA